MIGKKETVLLSTIILASIVAVPYMASSSFADSKIKSKVNFSCTYENSGNGDNIPVLGAAQTGSNLALTGPAGPGATGTSGSTTGNTGNAGNNNGASTATGGSGGSSGMGDSSLEGTEANIDERNPCVFELNVISVDSH